MTSTSSNSFILAWEDISAWTKNVKESEGRKRLLCGGKIYYFFFFAVMAFLIDLIFFKSYLRRRNNFHCIFSLIVSGIARSGILTAILSPRYVPNMFLIYISLGAMEGQYFYFTVILFS